MRKAYWAHASYHLFRCQRLGAAQEKEATPERRSPPSPRLSRVRKNKIRKKSGGHVLVKNVSVAHTRNMQDRAQRSMSLPYGKKTIDGSYLWRANHNLT